MIAYLEQFKQERREAFTSGDPLIIRAWAKRNNVAVPVDDAELLRLIALCPEWD